MGQIRLFTFLEKKIDNAQYKVLVAKAMEKAAFRELALHIAVTYVANALSKCEFKTYENGKEVKGETYYKLNVRPNPNENSSQFIQHFVENYYYNKGALIVNHEGGMYVADSFDLDESNPLKPYVYKNVTFGSKTLKHNIPRSDVVHLRLNDYKVKELVDAVGMEYGEVISLAMQSFKRTNGKKYKLLLDQYTAGDPQFKKTYEEVIQAQLKNFIESDGTAVYPKYNGVDLQEFSTAQPTGSGDILAVRKEIFDVTAQAIRIPLPMMYGNITNMDEIVKVFLTFCIDPIADMVSEEFTGQTYGYEGWSKGNRIHVDTSNITHVDIFEVAEAVEKLVSSGMCSIDELRPYLNFNPLGTEFGRRHYLTKNFEPAENVLTQGGGEK